MMALFYRLRTSNVALVTVIAILIFCLITALVALKVVYEGLFLLIPILVMIAYWVFIEEQEREHESDSDRMIADLQTLNEALQKTNTLLNTATKLGGVGAWEFGIKDQRLRWAEQMQTILGTTRSFVDLDDLELIYSNESCRSFTERILDCTHDRTPFVVQLETVATETEANVMRVIGIPVIQDNEVVSIRGVALTDNRQLDHAELELTRSYEELDKLKLEVMKVLKVTAHDLGSFVNGIIGLTSLISPNALSAPEDKEALRLIRESGERARTLISELMCMRSIDERMTIKSSDVDLAQMLTGLVKISRLTAERKEIAIHLDAPRGIIVPIDSPKISRVVNNIIHNAIKFSHPGQKILVRLTSTSLRAIISVQDFGVGIPSDMQDKIFDLFTSGKPGTKGEVSFGIGLHISRSIMECHSGTISVVRPVEGGTIFKIELPISMPAEVFRTGTYLN